MKNLLLVFVTLYTCTLMAGCKNKTHTAELVTPPRYNGEYALTFHTLEGNTCEDTRELVIVVRGGEIYDDRSDPGVNILGTLDSVYAGQPPELKYGLVDYLREGPEYIDLEFAGEFLDQRSLVGDWSLVDGSCYGYFEGLRVASEE